MATTYRVSGMTCAGCVRAVTNAIESAAPGTSISIDLACGLVTLEGEAAEATIRRAVEEAGFGFGGLASA